MSEVAHERNIFDSLTEVFKEVNKDKDQQREIDRILFDKYKIPHATFNEILVNPSKLESLSKEELIILTKVIYELTKDEGIDPESFYTQKEIGKALKYQHEQVEQLTLPYTFEGVIAAPTGRDYVTILSYKEIADLYKARILSYNFNAQRLSKKTVTKKGKLTEKADVNLRSVNNIVRLMKEGKYKADTLLFNILVDGNDKVDYDNGDLTIGEGTTINLIDGMHRVQAIIKVLQENPDFEGYINVALKHFPLSESQFMLGQVNTVNRFDKTLVKHYMGESIGAQITKDIMNTPELRQKVSIKTTLDRKINYYTNFAILSEAIETIFEPQNAKDRYDIAELLKKFFGYLISSYEDRFKNRNEHLKTSWFSHHNMFVLFVVLAKKLQDKYGADFPVSEITRAIDAINFSKEGSELNDILVGQGKVNSNQVKKLLRKFAEEKIDELLG